MIASRARQIGAELIAVLEAPALIAGLNDVAVVGEPVKQRGRHLGITEHCRPVCKGEVGRHGDRGPFIKPADQMEEQLSARLRKWQIAKFVEHH
jgi:hypothetical protein